MKLNRIILENIRSYEHQEVVFPEGATLLSGDIGAGKTSILLAIEFALFGLQPGQRGTALLKNGEDSGSVVMEFEVDGNEIMIERCLKRSKTISQDYSAITINGEKKELAVTELKSKILELLDYPKEFAKKQNLLYKFTVYTPQEEMKQIILQDAETRINTLRHVFGIDKYKKILENVSIVLSKIREEKRLKEGITLNVENDKAEMLLQEEVLEAKRLNLSSVEKDLFAKKEVRRKIEEELSEISGKINEKNDLQKEIEKTQIMISTKKDTLASNKKKIGILIEQIEELRKLDFDEEEIVKLEAEIEVLRKEKTRFNEEILKIASEISSLNLKNKDDEGIKTKLKHIEVCPTCLQDVNENYKNNVLNKIDSSVIANEKRIEELGDLKKDILKKIDKIEEDVESSQKKISELRILKVKLDSKKEKQEQIEEVEKNNDSLGKDLEMLDKHIGILKSSILEMNKFEILYEGKQKEFAFAQKDEREVEIKIAELKKEIDLLVVQIKNMEDKIKKTEAVQEQLNRLNKLEHWLSKNFVPLISFTEKNVMATLKAEFSKLFNQWFEMLVSDNFEVRLSEDFTPIIEQQDYDIDYGYLSGGERTAIALAYRLALNQVINSLMSKIKTKDLVILDEPTDGFSEQQLDKMRDIFQELDVGQLIIVSHERKIEDFVENVIKLKKVNGVSEKD